MFKPIMFTRTTFNTYVCIYIYIYASCNNATGLLQVQLAEVSTCSLGLLGKCGNLQENTDEHGNMRGDMQKMCQESQ